MGRGFVVQRTKFLPFRTFVRHAGLLCLLAATSSTKISSETLRPSGAAAAIVDELDRESLVRVVAKLSGADTIQTDADTVRILTRYALGPQIASARSYLMREIRAIGYEPSVQSFVLSVSAPDLTGAAYSAIDGLFWTADAGGTVYRAPAAQIHPQFEKCGNIGAIVFDLECDASGKLWAACRLNGSAAGGLYLSTDRGESWSLRASGVSTYALVTLAFEHELYGMAAGSNGSVIRTIDGGDTWWPLDPQTFGYAGFRGAATNGEMRFWLVTDSGVLYDTPDLGGAWTRRALASGPLSAIDFHGENAGVIVGSRSAYYTKDAGASWTPVSVPTEFTAVRMVDSLRVLASGTGGEIWRSEDGGAVWERFGTECSEAADVWTIAGEESGVFWFAGRDLVRRILWDFEIKNCDAHQFADTTWGRNISFRHEGAGEGAHRVFLTAHYDSYSGSTPLECAPGADDNATGVAAVLECARVLRAKRTERSVEFVLFDGEELGLKGSRYYAPRLDTGIVYEGALNLDMLGYEPNAVMTAVIAGRSGNAGDSTVAARLTAAIDSFGLSLETSYVQGNLTSDQIAFWEVGIPAVLLIEGTRLELTPVYHSCQDALGALNLDFFETCAKTALGALALMAGVLPPAAPPPAIALHQNYPNPFNAGTTVSYALPSPAAVEIALYDVSGRRVALIARGTRGAGAHEEPWDGTGEGGGRVPSGVYFLHLRSAAGEATRKIVILR